MTRLADTRPPRGATASRGCVLDLDAEELAEASERLERLPASEAIRFAVERFGDRLLLASSFQDCVLIDVATSVEPSVEVVFLDTQMHFPETYDYVETVRRRYDLNLRIVTPLIGPDELWRDDPNECCVLRKVEPLARALEGRDAWVTGLRRVEADTRADAPIVGIDPGRGVVKVNPLAPWTDADIEAYARERGLPEHPLRALGYASIGCAPCTGPVASGAGPRSGRWAGRAKTECGLHGWPQPR